MTIAEQQLQRLVIKYPQFREIVKAFGEDKKSYQYFREMCNKLTDKTLIISRTPDTDILYAELSLIIKYGYLRIKEITTIDLLDSYLGVTDSMDLRPSLTQVMSPILVIKDSHAYVPNRQKANFITQVCEQNLSNKVIYVYKGTMSQYTTELPTLQEYFSLNNFTYIGSSTQSTQLSTQDSYSEDIC